MTAGAKGGGKGRGGKARSGLAPEEQALWDHAAQTMAPVKKLKARVLARPGEDLIESAPRTPKRSERGTNGGGAKPESPSVLAGASSPQPLTRVTVSSAPPLADFDRKAARRLRAGQIEITSRIDLHGMRQDEAHAALQRFLHACQRRGERWVLVITGKGGPRRGHDEDDGEGAHRSVPGVLKRNVPRWLAEPDLRAIVVSTTEAAIHHGGGGALYVLLRKLK